MRCFFCGGDAEMMEGVDYFQMECQGCSAMGPRSRDEASARMAWEFMVEMVDAELSAKAMQ